ncbi:MAG: hydrolase [Candidatus Saccharibacteria bacterium]|nr:hydrolase [Candidatus Saccharibacteria bacterium]
MKGMQKSLLLIVDAQQGFIGTEATRRAVSKIKALETAWHERQWPVVFSRFINKPESPWVRFIGSDSLMHEPDTALDPAFKTDDATVYDKTTYAAWSPEISQRCNSEKIDTVILCGVDTDQCVLATAIAIFESGLRPVVVQDCCASGAGSEFHEAALLLIQRLIGRDQLVMSKDVL